MKPTWIAFWMLFVAALLAGSIGAFLLYVPLMSVVSVSAILLAFALMFVLGAHAGGRRIRIGHDRPRSV